MALDHYKILWGLVVVLACAVVGLGVVVLRQGAGAANGPMPPPVLSQELNFSVGGQVVDVVGVVVSKDGQSITIDTAMAKVYLDPRLFSALAPEVSVQATEQTIIGEKIAPKKGGEVFSSTDEYNAMVQTLLEEPVANRARLDTLLMPLSFDTRLLSLGDLQTGDFLLIQSTRQADGSYVALRITRTTAPSAAELDAVR
jgi:hypothetical protein